MHRSTTLLIVSVSVALVAAIYVVVFIRTAQRRADYVLVSDAIGDVARHGPGVSPLGIRLRALVDDELTVILDREEALIVVERTIAASLSGSWEDMRAIARSSAATPNASAAAETRDFAARLPPNHRPEGWPGVSAEELLRWRFERASRITHVMLDRIALEVRDAPMQSLDAQLASWRALKGVSSERHGLLTSGGSSFFPSGHGASGDAASADPTLLILMRVRAADGAEAALVYEFVRAPGTGWWSKGVWSLTLRSDPGEEVDERRSGAVLPPL